MSNTSFGKGIVLSLAAYGIWGLLPLYWRSLGVIDSRHILAFRILCSLALVALILSVKRDNAWLKVFTGLRQALLIVVTSLTLCANWGLYIWAVNQGHTIEASLGYYINPLVSVVLGLVFLGERLRPLQWAAFGIAGLGVVLITALSGTLPWISLGLALTFGVYGLLKKKIGLSALESLGAETIASLPVGIFLLFFDIGEGGAGLARPLGAGLVYLGGLPSLTWVLLLFSGMITALPLYCFARAAKLLPLSTLGFTQFLSPTLQFLMGFFVFGEFFPARYFVAFGLIWLSVILYIFSLFKCR